MELPFQGNYTQEDFAQQLVDTFKEANIHPSRVWLQSFVPEDIFQWIENDPEFGLQAVYLDERADLTTEGYETAVASLPDLAARGVKIIAPSIWQLITANNETQKIVPSSYAIAAREAGLDVCYLAYLQTPRNVANMFPTDHHLELREIGTFRGGRWILLQRCQPFDQQ